MANKNLFASKRNTVRPNSDCVNEAGGIAYGFDPRHELAQYAATGCLNSTFYAAAGQQLKKILKVCLEVEPEFIAKTALYARSRGHMKDLPALLCAVLSAKGPEYLKPVFPRVIDNPKMLRNFVQMIRSGAVGRTSLGSLPKRLVREWLETRSDEQIFTGSVGQSPSLADIVKMVHPRPQSENREALYGYLIGRGHKRDLLPRVAREYETFKEAKDRLGLSAPNVPFQMLTALELRDTDWKTIARNASWQTTRMNLNTFLRHGVFQDAELVRLVATRLRRGELIRTAKAFPYQLMAAFLTASAEIPPAIRDALQEAMEIALENVPLVPGKVFVFPDVSGSMQSAVTGHRKGSTSVVRCVDVAALVAAAIIRRNPDAEVIPFHDRVEAVTLNPRDSVMTNAKILASLPSGGTNCSAALRHLNKKKACSDLVVYVSDNQSWVNSALTWQGNNPTETLRQWALFRERNPQARMVCIDIQPYGHTQAPDRDDILNVGGFSDEVFLLLAAAAEHRADAGYWVRQIESIPLTA